MKMLPRGLRLTAALSFVLFSCSDPALEEDDISRITSTQITGTERSLMTAVPDSVSFRKIDLYLDRGPAATGSLSVIIRTVAGTFIDSVTVPVTSLSVGSSWKTFVFPRFSRLDRGMKYRIYVIRSDPHNYSTRNYIFWRTSASGVDAYPQGVNDVHPGWTLDFAFRTYTEGDIDQQQPLTNYGFYLSSNHHRWQEFVADYPRVNLTGLQLFLTVGPAPSSDTLEVQVRGLRDGSNSLDSVIYKTKVPVSSLPTGSHWSTFNLQGSLQRDEPYSIIVRRRGSHSTRAGKFVYWHASTGSKDLYLDGYADLAFNAPVDYAFKTFSQGGLDQQQVNTTDTIRIANSVPRWQTFTPRNQ